MNVLTVSGIIHHTPRVHDTRTGERVLNLNVGVRQRTKKDGQWIVETLWLDITLFGHRADGLGNLLKKGSQCGATGELRVRKYEGRDGTPKQAVELIASNIWPLDWAPPREQPSTPPEQRALTRTHRDEFAGQRSRVTDMLRGQGELPAGGLVDPNTGDVHFGDDDRLLSFGGDDEPSF